MSDGPWRDAAGTVERGTCSHCGASMPLIADRTGLTVIVRHRDNGVRGTTCPGSYKAAPDGREPTKVQP